MKRQIEQTRTQTQERVLCEDEAKIEIMFLQAKGCQGLQGTSRREERSME